MEKDLYRIMKEIIEKKGKDNTMDVKYIGKVTEYQKDGDIDIKVVRDVYMIIEEMEDGTLIQKFYDENMNFFGGKNKEGKLIPSQNEMEKNPNLLEQIEKLNLAAGISLNEIEKQINVISKKIGVKKNEVLAMTEINLEQKIGEKEKNKEEQKIILEDDEDNKEEDKEEIIKDNENILKNVNVKQEIDLDKKIDDRYTLRRNFRC